MLDIFADANDYISYAHRSFVMARKHDWDHALQDAIKSISIQPSLTGHISKGIALCGKGHVRDARAAFIVAFMFTNQDSETVHFLILIMAIALFNAYQHEEAMLLVKELVDACPNTDTRACHAVRGISAFNGAHHDEAVDHFTAAINSSAFSLKFKLDIHLIYEDLVVLFGWDLESFWLTTYQKRCQAFLSGGKVEEALKAHEFMMDTIDKTTKASCLDWSNGKFSVLLAGLSYPPAFHSEFKKQCSALAAHNDRVLGAEIPGQGQDGYDAEPNFSRGMQEHPRTQPQQHLGHLKRFKRAVTRSPPTVHPPAPAPPTVSPPASTFKTLVRHLFTRPPDRAMPPVVDVPFAKGRETLIFPNRTPIHDSDRQTLTGVEAKYYGPFIKATDIALACLEETKVDGMCAAVSTVDMICQQNDMPMRQTHQTVTSTRKPDLVILPFNSACAAFETNNKDAEKDAKKRDGKRKVHMDKNAIESPKNLPWKDIF
ncbi:hypothetical protein BDR05DRAFT_993324 [Suillus weaverae]|nr:hypothetical protein BDR05DRAFT_993324 [Suillus weaverae]